MPSNPLFVARLPTSVSTDKKLRPSAFLSVLQPRLSIDVNLLKRMDGGEIRLWMLLREMSRGRQHIVADQKQIATLLDTTQSTISRRFKMLRALRVIALLPSNAKNIRERQKYMVFDQQESLEQILSIDAEYLVFIQEASKNGSKRLRQLCIDDLYALPQEDYQVYFELPQDYMDMRQEEADTGEAISESDALLNESHDADGESLLCTNELRGEGHESPLCTDELRHENRESPLCTNELRGEGHESPLCTDELRHENRESPLCTNELRGESHESPLCTDELREDIYNRARAHTHTRSRIKTIGFNNTSFQDGGESEGRNVDFPRGFPSEKTIDPASEDEEKNSPFAFLGQQPLVEFIPMLELAHGKATTHAILNCMKQGTYGHQGKEFRYRLDAEVAAIIFMSLLDRKKEIQSPLHYVTALLFRAANNTLTFRGDQYARFCQLTGKAEPKLSEKPAKTRAISDAQENPGLTINDGTKVMDKYGAVYTIENQVINPMNGKAGKNGKRLLARFTDLDEIRNLVVDGQLQIVEDAS